MSLHGWFLRFCLTYASPTHSASQVAILAGDFLLARASVSLAALRNPEAIMLMSQSLEHLVAAEILQASMECGRLCFLRVSACQMIQSTGHGDVGSA